MKVARPANELERLQALRDHRILDTPPEPQFDALVELAAELFDVPASLISLVDADRQWFKAKCGVTYDGTGRDVSFCTHALIDNEPFVIEDASRDPRFADNPYVTGEPFIRFYAGVPLFVAPGLSLGSFCIMDSKPRQITPSQLHRLQQIGAIAAKLIKSHRARSELVELSRDLARQSELVARQSEELAVRQRILECGQKLARMGAWECDEANGTLSWSDGMYALHELEPGFQINWERLEHFYPPADWDRLSALIRRFLGSNQPFSYEGRMITARGNERWVRIEADLEMRDGMVLRRFGMKQDITEQKLMNDRVARLASFDTLTGLNNRAALQQRLEAISGEERPAGTLFALVMLDLDGFKEINDTHGHLAGDECLKRIARRLSALPGRKRMSARIGGDEFVVLLEAAETMPAIVKVAEALRTAIARPVRWRGHSFSLATSIGIAVRAPGEAIDPAALLQEADLALYAAKAGGRNQHVFFQPQLLADANGRFEVIQDIRRALKARELVLHYQPKVELKSGLTVGYEALLRWPQADGTMRMPGEFRAALEDAETSREIGRYVVAAVIAQAARWKAEGVAFGRIAFNLSAADFRTGRMAQMILDAIAAAGLAPSMFEVEVTEDVFLARHTGPVAETCRELKQAGLTIAFDDFGTGYASLTHLNDFPVDVIKLDRSFIAKLGTHQGTTAIIQAIVGLATALGMTVVAEGVETEAQAMFLKAIGCPRAQGYLFGRAEPPEAISARAGVARAVA